MARLQSKALGGYYPFPAHLVPHLAQHLHHTTGAPFGVLDPCAGTGAAALDLLRHLVPDPGGRQTSFYGVEMEDTRASELQSRARSVLGYDRPRVFTGDAFTVDYVTGDLGQNEGVPLLFLNPPYDVDTTYGRLEERFLRRFTGALCPSGVLVFVVPFYALEASAVTLATHFYDHEIFRFPQADFVAFRQVVVFAKRHREPLLVPDPQALATIRAWSENVDTVHDVGDFMGPPMDLPTPTGWQPGYVGYPPGFATFQMTPLDVSDVRKGFRPWCMTGRSGTVQNVHNTIPDTADLAAFFGRTFPMAIPPKPAHIAAGIAAGVFDGERIAADDPAAGLPDLLVKGVFDREFVEVDERTNQEGDVTGVEQVQQPRLVVTVLDLTTHHIHTVRASPEITGSVDPATMTTGDLLTHYGLSLLSVLRAHCPVSYDPQRTEQHWPLPVLARPLYEAQAHATRALVTLLGGPGLPVHKRRGLAAVVLGEIGSGKSSVALATALASGAHNVLILCPPHLLDSWTDQIRFVCPWATVRVLETTTDVDDHARWWKTADHNTFHISLLSRETAKLGHGYAPIATVTPSGRLSCPGCGAAVPTNHDLVKKHAVCTTEIRYPGTDHTKALLALAIRTVSIDPRNVHMTGVLSGGPATLGQLLDHWVGVHTQWASSNFKVHERANLASFRQDPRSHAVADTLLGLVLANPTWHTDSVYEAALASYLALLAHPATTVRIAHRLFAEGRKDLTGYGQLSRLQRYAAGLLLLLPSTDPLQTETLYAWDKEFGRNEVLIRCKHKAKALVDNTNTYAHGWEAYGVSGGVPTYRKHLVGDTQHLRHALAALWTSHGWVTTGACGERLYQAVPEPRRFPLATYISRYHRKLFDFVVVDEAHEYSGDGSAQERAAHRLTGCGAPVLLLTGSVMNGYAKSLFANWWALFPKFRREFGREEGEAFVTRYGYRKRLLQDVDKQTGEVVEYGSQSDRVERRERDLGNAAGVLPLFVLRMLEVCVPLHKKDLALNLPPVLDIPVDLEPSDDQLADHQTLLKALLERIRRDKGGPMAGKLWGQMAQIPSHFDLCTDDTGNTPDGSYEIRYPQSVGGGLVAKGGGYARTTLLPKERELLATLEREWSEGRPVLILTLHVTVAPRLQALIERELGRSVPVLDPHKVKPKRREEWINKQVVGVKAPALLTNPWCVQTGLNNLLYFPTQWWHENPQYNPIVYRQAVGRSDRIGQTKEVRVYFPRYRYPTTLKGHSLLLHKVAVSMATDGLDSGSALAAAGVGDIGVSGLSVGQELYRMLGNQW